MNHEYSYDYFDLIDKEYSSKRRIYGEDVTVAILDSGMARHSDLMVPPSRVIEFIDFIHRKKSMYDDNGHGTHIAGIIGSVGRYKKGYIGMAPKVKLIILKVLD